jgi:uncharacterized metal-binding protein YceD (DUF177 family)
MTSELPFSRPVKVETLPRDGLEQSIEATPKERAALAEANDLADLASLTARLVIKRSGKGVRVTGAFHAEATQTCVVSLEPFPVTLDEPIEARFVPEGERRPRAADSDPIGLEDLDEPDPLVDGKVDLGALTAEFLALSLDPYPRKPDAVFEPPVEPDADPSPFGALARLPRVDD